MVDEFSRINADIDIDIMTASMKDQYFGDVDMLHQRFTTQLRKLASRWHVHGSSLLTDLRPVMTQLIDAHRSNLHDRAHWTSESLQRTVVSLSSWVVIPADHFPSPSLSRPAPPLQLLRLPQPLPRPTRLPLTPNPHPTTADPVPAADGATTHTPAPVTTGHMTSRHGDAPPGEHATPAGQRPPHTPATVPGDLTTPPFPSAHSPQRRSPQRQSPAPRTKDPQRAPDTHTSHAQKSSSRRRNQSWGHAPQGHSTHSWGKHSRSTSNTGNWSNPGKLQSWQQQPAATTPACPLSLHLPRTKTHRAHHIPTASGSIYGEASWTQPRLIHCEFPHLGSWGSWTRSQPWTSPEWNKPRPFLMNLDPALPPLQTDLLAECWELRTMDMADPIPFEASFYHLLGRESQGMVFATTWFPRPHPWPVAGGDPEAGSGIASHHAVMFVHGTTPDRVRRMSYENQIRPAAWRPENHDYPSFGCYAQDSLQPRHVRPAFAELHYWKVSAWSHRFWGTALCQSTQDLGVRGKPRGPAQRTATLCMPPRQEMVPSLHMPC